jgi:hypothetical protein
VLDASPPVPIISNANIQEYQMKFSHLSVAILAVALSPSVASAQAAPAAAASTGLTAGAVVHDQQGGEVGKIASVDGDTIILDTGNSKATLPRSAFAIGKKGPTVNATKAQIDAAVAAAFAKTNAALSAALVPGAQVFGEAGAAIGTVKEVVGEQVILDRPAGSVSLNKNMFAATAGKLTLKLTSAELDAAAQASADNPATPAAPATPTVQAAAETTATPSAPATPTAQASATKSAAPTAPA